MAAIISILSGGVIAAILVFIQYLITRHDNKLDQQNVILKKLNQLDNTMYQIKSDIQQENAITWRRAILRFGDEVYEDKHHRKDLFDQTLVDIDRYEKYCEQHPEFKNSQAVMTIKMIKDKYKELFIKRKFD